jgi:hypothetical protein
VHTLAHLANRIVLPVVEFAIIEDELHVFHKFADVCVLLLLDLCLNRSKVHRLLHDRQVVWDVERFDVHWFQEDPGLAVAA